jgi:hypothetical protein
MAKKLYFFEFSRALVARSMPLDQLPEYVTFDPTSAVPKLIFRADALLDVPPTGYDVDEAIYRYLRVLRDERRTQKETFAYAGAKSVVAEGDSWFNLPEFLRPPAIADWISRHRRYRVNNIAHWGHTLREILQDREYVAVLDADHPSYFMFTAGGNDLQEGLETGAYVHAYDPSRPLEDYLTGDGVAELERIEQGHRSVFCEVSAKYPTLPILCHGYDYPRPLVGNGKYIGQFLRRKGIPDDLMTPIMASIVNRLNTVIARAAAPFSSVRFLNCRRVTEPFTWYDDMHPGSDGFEALANEFEEAMSRP